MRLFSFFLYIIVFSGVVFPQPEIKFSRYTTSQGLAHNDVLTICQDDFGFIWFGTKHGCSRFDGVHFKNYVFDENTPGSIGDGWVNKIVKDIHGELWFGLTGSAKTLLKYDYVTDNFIDYGPKIQHLFQNNNGIQTLWTLFADSKGYIWFQSGTSEPVCLDSNSGELVAPYRDVFNDSIKSIKNFYEDKDGNLWFASNPGLFCYHISQNQIYHFTSNLGNEHSLSSNNVICVFQDADSQIWVGTYKGLNKLVSPLSTNVKFKHYVHNPDIENTLPNNIIYDIIEDKNNNLIIATVNGLSVFNRKEEHFQNFYKDETDNHSINSNLIRSVFKDKNNNVWIGTNLGVNRVHKKNFKRYTHSLYKNSLAHNKVDCMCELPNKKLMIATPKGVNSFDFRTEKFELIVGLTSDNNALQGAPLSIHPVKDNSFWIGTWNGGLSFYNYPESKVVNYINKPTTGYIKRVYSLFVDSDNNLWINANAHGLEVYNNAMHQQNVYKFQPGDNSSLSENRITCMFEDSRKRLWVGTVTGINLFNGFSKGTFKRYLERLQIYHIIEGSDNNIWIATNLGLYRLSPETEKIIRFSAKQGLPGSISNIIEDEDNYFWVSTSDIFARLKIKRDSIIDKTVFHKEDGLINGDFLPNSCCSLSNGLLAFGGTEGFCVVDPDNIERDTTVPVIVATNFKIAEQELKVGEEKNNQVVLDKSITLKKELTLNHKNNAFSIEFVGLQYNMPQYNKYAYRLDGYDIDKTKWHYTDVNNREAKYMNLDAGDYIFKVKAANSYGHWNSEIYQLKLTILAPWWQQIWFYALVTGCIVGTFIAILKIRLKSLQKQKQKLRKLVDLHTEELKQMNIVLLERQEELEQRAQELITINTNLENKTHEVEQMAKQLHEADQSKLRFFANLSHEFRTPLSLIVAPLEKYISLNPPVDWNSLNMPVYLKLIHRNAQRLLRLINQIIDFRKIDQKRKELVVSNNNIIQFIEEIIEEFSGLAEEKNIQLKMKSDELKVKNKELRVTSEVVPIQYSQSSFTTHHSSLIAQFWFDPDIMEKILYNLISNAIKYTPEGGEISIAVAVETRHALSLQPQLAIKISDTGIGLKPEHLTKIFDRFYRVKTRLIASQPEGTGIGLAYTKELVELHKGQITVESEVNKGTSFILSFPVGTEHYKILGNTQNKTGISGYTRSMIKGIKKVNEKDSFIVGNPEANPTGRFKDNAVLIVEDNTDLRQFMNTELENSYQIYEADNGEQGWQIVAEKYPDIVISDIMMPVMDGIELCKLIKSDENTCHIPIILLTAKHGDANIIEGLRTGAGDYITKPFNMEVLKNKVNNLLINQMRLKEKFNKSLEIQPAEITHSQIDEKFLKKAVNVVKENLENSEFTNEDFVNHMHYSRAMVYRKLKNITGQSVSEFIRSIRLKTAARLFNEGYDNISEVCYMVGFKHPNTFSGYFSKNFGQPPSGYIKEIRNKRQNHKI